MVGLTLGGAAGGAALWLVGPGGGAGDGAYPVYCHNCAKQLTIYLIVSTLNLRSLILHMAVTYCMCNMCIDANMRFVYILKLHMILCTARSRSWRSSCGLYGSTSSGCVKAQTRRRRSRRRRRRRAGGRSLHRPAPQRRKRCEDQVSARNETAGCVLTRLRHPPPPPIFLSLSLRLPPLG